MEWWSGFQFFIVSTFLVYCAFYLALGYSRLLDAVTVSGAQPTDSVTHTHVSNSPDSSPTQTFHVMLSRVPWALQVFAGIS